MRATPPCPLCWEVTWSLPPAWCPAPGRPSAGGAPVPHGASTWSWCEAGVRGPRGGATAAGSRAAGTRALAGAPSARHRLSCALGSPREAALLPREGGSGGRGSPSPREGPCDVPLPAAQSHRRCGGGRWAPGLAGAGRVTSHFLTVVSVRAPTASVLSPTSQPPPHSELPTPPPQRPRRHPRT